MRRRRLVTGVIAAAGFGLLSGGCAYHGYGHYGYGYHGGYGGHCHSGPPAGAVIIGTAALFYAIGSACH